MSRKWGVMAALLFAVLFLACYTKGMGGMYPAAGEADESGQKEEPPKIAITFDDGPSPLYTEKLLDGLKERGVKASFFLIGKSAEQYPELVKRMAQEEHVIGNHTYSHVQLSACSYEEAVEEIRKENEILFGLTGKVPVYIRPPFGSYTSKLEEKFPMEKVLWTIDPEDWKVRNTQTIVRHVISHAKDGGIILLHDQYATSVEAAFQIIDQLKAEGWEFVTVEELTGTYDVH